MERLSMLLALCEGIHQLLVDSPHKGPVMWNYDVFFDVNMNKLFITHAPVHINDFRGVRARYVKRTG